MENYTVGRFLEHSVHAVNAQSCSDGTKLRNSEM